MPILPLQICFYAVLRQCIWSPGGANGRRAIRPLPKSPALSSICGFIRAEGHNLVFPRLRERATDERTYSLADLKGERGTLIMFICNHCPYVKAVIDRIVRGARELKKFGVNSAAICSNDAASYPEDLL